MPHWNRLPEEVEAHIWKLYVRMHVLPVIRRFPSHRWLHCLVRSFHHSKRYRARDSLTFWTELITCHWRSLDEARVQLESSFPDTTVYKDYDDGTLKLFWTYHCNDGGEHILSAMQDSDRYYLSYHGPTTYETVVVDVHSNEMHTHARLVSRNAMRSPTVRSWTRYPLHRLPFETSTLSRA